MGECANCGAYLRIVGEGSEEGMILVECEDCGDIYETWTDEEPYGVDAYTAGDLEEYTEELA
jgi:uncharacterized Zn finger protein